jgi:hypothetical protein
MAVDSAPGGGEYVVTRGAGLPSVPKYSAAGAFEYTLDEAGSETTINLGPIAVDPSNGTVYVTATNANTFAPVIDSFSQTTGAFVASFNGESGSPDGGFVCPTSLAADPSHHVYVLDPCKGRVDRYSSAGAWEATVDDGSRGAPQAVATDPKTGELYVAESGPSGLQITNFTAGGTSVVSTFPAANVGGVSGLAVGPDGTVYAADDVNSVIDRFTGFVGPTVTTAAASEVDTTSATLNGTVNAEGIASRYHYEYGLESTYGSVTDPIEAGAGNTPDEAPGPVTGLVPNTTYHYRIVGSNTSGSIVGEDETVTTALAPPKVDGAPTFVTAITPTGANVHATVNPEHSATTFRIEYGTTTAYGSTSLGGEVGEQSTDVPVAATLSGLEPGTLYHFRVSAEDGVEGPQTGADGTFITAPASPAAGSEVTTQKATLIGTINPHGVATTYHFNYGPSTSYGVMTPEMDGGSGSGEEQVVEHITGLSPGTTYHVQVVATTNGVVRAGADGTFTTPASPTATVTDPTAVTTGSATLEGAADTHGLAGSYHFEVTALEGSFATSTEERPLIAVTGSQHLSVPVSGLPPGQSLQVRLVVTSNEATEYSEPASFATAPLPPEAFLVPPSPGSVYGCTAPNLTPHDAKAKPGSVITVTGNDLGLNGTVLLGENTLVPTDWTTSGFTIEVPADATGTLGLTVNCGVASNTIAIATTSTPTNVFAIRHVSVKGTNATVSVTLPGAGSLQATGARTKAVTTTVTEAGTQVIKLELSRVGAQALAKAKHRALTVKVQLRFTPSGGHPSTKTATLTFEHKAAH